MKKTLPRMLVAFFRLRSGAVIPPKTASCIGIQPNFQTIPTVYSIFTVAQEIVLNH
ncbi:hypothetical protein PO883_12005 [Massilia sp. DJPM01]|uniref:hypothetical protein n=1 Tax=Massilia sp. DJPM01 TaxID=3024404 RepID=UPI00259F069F|nr:hypothetical protein [Massilia sp. DJPM01]MDM5177914.1 hypothetical protein [Massilia sp. DJPM01]